MTSFYYPQEAPGEGRYRALRRRFASPMGLLLIATTVLALNYPSFAVGQSREMYRYTNADGVKVIAYQVPPEFVANGYDVLSSTGAVLSVVPRTLNDGERGDLDSEAQREREAQKEIERLRKWDESLLLRYSTIEDIEAARERALGNLRLRVNILNGKLRSLKQQVESYQTVAANMERLGTNVDQDHLTAMANLRSDIDSTERALKDRRVEIDNVDDSYDKDVERFSTLLDIVEMRKGMVSGRKAKS